MRVYRPAAFAVTVLLVGGGLQSRRGIGQSGAVPASRQDAGAVTGADPGDALSENRAHPGASSDFDPPSRS